MAKTTPRLHLEAPLQPDTDIPLAREQGHYLTHVLRLVGGDVVEVFNSRDGAWLAYLTDVGKKGASIRCERPVSAVTPPPDIDYLFAPLKHARLDYMMQKATELGARRLRPVMTARTIAERVNLERMRANAVEAAEQCNLVFVPEVLEPQPLTKVIAAWEPGRKLIYCDETLGQDNPLERLRQVSPPAAVLVGPEEGGFTEEERLLKAQAFVVPIGGPAHSQGRYGGNCRLGAGAGGNRGLGRKIIFAGMSIWLPSVRLDVRCGAGRTGSTRQRRSNDAAHHRTLRNSAHTLHGGAVSPRLHVAGENQHFHRRWRQYKPGAAHPQAWQLY
ncbi:MAG: 16S rRNA (uracil(1498)-N(3))-methyltransferase [Hyphomicrobiales bacterium]